MPRRRKSEHPGQLSFFTDEKPEARPSSERASAKVVSPPEAHCHTSSYEPKPSNVVVLRKGKRRAELSLKYEQDSDLVFQEQATAQREPMPFAKVLIAIAAIGTAAVVLPTPLNLDASYSRTTRNDQTKFGVKIWTSPSTPQ